MSQDNINQDTPQESPQQQEYTSLEEAVFGTNDGSGNIESAFTSGNQEPQEAAPVYPDKGQPANEGVNNQEVDNDTKRYQYWQSQADKLKAENQALKESQLARTQQVPAQAPQSLAQEPQPSDEFPPPPEKPQSPRNYNREEAYSDPSSDSARYMDDLEQWRDDMSEYNSLRTQYQGALMEEQMQNIQDERVREAQRQEYANTQSQKASNIRNHVMGHYGMNENEATDFMHKMSNPKSLNIDNLVQLYRIQQGGAAKQQTAPATPSDSFQQVQNAQQVPSPMGVMPSGNNSGESKGLDDKIMDAMIGNYNSKNPWK